MHKIALIPGDGIGPEVTAEGVKVLKYLAKKNNIKIQIDKFNAGANRYLETGETLNEEDLNKLAQYDAIYLGAVGDPRVPAGILEKGILLKLRFYFDMYVNLRPVKLLDKRYSPLKGKGKEDINFTVVRENTEGIYTGLGGFFKKDTLDEVATQEMLNTRKGVERVIRYAFDYAERRGREPKVTLCDKSNVLTFSHNLWQRTFADVKKDFENVNSDHYLVDAITMKMVRNPEIFDIIVSCNLFGDIITDLGAELQGGMGLAVSGNINPEGVSMFEPVHGSAPDIAGNNTANPLAAILAVGMLLDYLAYPELASLLEDKVSEALQADKLTPDMGGNLSTEDVGDYIIKSLEEDEDDE